MLSDNDKALARGKQEIAKANELYELFNKARASMYNKLVAKPTIRDKRKSARAASKRK